MADYDITKLSSQVNYTDPIVRKDPEIDKTKVAKINISDKDDEYSPTAKDGNVVDMKKVEGISIPIIQVNNTVLHPWKIKYMKLDYDDFFPSIKITAYQEENELMEGDTPGMDNHITVIMTSRVDGAYKPISMDFYIDRVQVKGHDVYYWGSYKLLSLEQNKTEQVIFSADGSNEHPTTYEFFYQIAVNCQLGYASTDQVKEITDDRYRFVMNQNYKECLLQHLKFGGLNELSVFDAWIDLYRYLTIVNVPWVLNEKLSPEDIGMRIETVTISERESDGSAGQSDTMMQRIITNYTEIAGPTNILIASYNWITNNNAIRTEGSLNNYQIASASGYTEEGNGSINQHDVEIIEDSPEGEEGRENYLYQRSSFIGTEMGNADEGYTPVLLQQQIRSNYLRKIRQKRLHVVMERTNLALQRGTLIYVLIMDYNDYAKRNDMTPEAFASSEAKYMNNVANTPVPSISLSGFYYIDGMSFEYLASEGEITQHLYLIKKDPYEKPNSNVDPAVNAIAD